MRSTRRSLRNALAMATVTGMVALAAPASAASYILTDLGVTNPSFNPVDGATSNLISMTPSGVIRPYFANTSYGGYSIQNHMISDLMGREYFTLTGPSGQPSTLDLGPQVGMSVYGYAVNASGTVVGAQYLAGRGNAKTGVAFLYTASGGESLLPSIGGPSAALAINDNGLIVGTSGLGDYRAFLTDGKAAWDLNSLIPSNSGLTLIDATGIDDTGRIVGTALDSQYRVHDYLLTPAAAVPEPSTIWLIMTGMGICAWKRGLC